MISTTCHCGAVHISIPRAPDTLTNCDCSICRRYGLLWRGSSMDVNARNFQPEQLGPVRIRRLDGAVTEEYLD
jgi:hypothetical protein